MASEVPIKASGGRRNKLAVAAAAALLIIAAIAAGIVAAVATSALAASNATVADLVDEAPAGSIVLMELTASGSVSDYEDTSALQSKFAAAVDVNYDRVAVTVRAASVIISATINVNASAVDDVIDALNSIVGTAAAASSYLGIPVTSVSSPVVISSPAKPLPDLLPPSRSNQLLRLLRVADDSGASIAVGRSYDGHPWEGVQPSPLSFSCYSAGCLVPTAQAGFSFQVLTYNGTVVTTVQQAARLLIQATVRALRVSTSALFPLRTSSLFCLRTCIRLILSPTALI